MRKIAVKDKGTDGFHLTMIAIRWGRMISGNRRWAGYVLPCDPEYPAERGKKAGLYIYVQSLRGRTGRNGKPLCIGARYTDFIPDPIKNTGVWEYDPMKIIGKYRCETIERHDPVLIKVIEKLGHKATNSYCPISIVEIDDDDGYHIHGLQPETFFSRKKVDWK